MNMKSKTAFTPFLTVLALSGCDQESTNAMDETDMAHSGPAMNFHRINPKLATGGHIVGDGVSELVAQGVALVIDLRDEPPEVHEERLAEVGIQWLNVPVVWDEPTVDNFAEFSRLMSENQGENIFVQCQANYRASAMTYAYRVTQGGVPEAEALKDLEAVWTPEGVWEAYVAEITGLR